MPWTGCLSVVDAPMDKDLFIDLEDFAKAFRKEVPPGVRINVKNVFGTAMEIDPHGKSRFELLCARIPLCPAHNGLQADQDDTKLYPVKIGNSGSLRDFPGECWWALCTCSCGHVLANCSS